MITSPIKKMFKQFTFFSLQMLVAVVVIGQA